MWKQKDAAAGDRDFWHDLEWPLVGALALVALLLGYWGYSAQLPAAGYSFWDLLYLDLQLFVIQLGDVDPPLHPALNIARFLAPAVAGYTALQALGELFSEQLQSLRLRRMRQHVIVCGLGRKGLVLVREFRRRGLEVVAVEQDAENDLVHQARQLGALVLIGDASDRLTLARAGAARAAQLFALCGSDGVNAEIALGAADLAGRRNAAPLQCVVHVFEPQLCALLRQRELAAGSGTGIRLEYFNVFDLGARVLLEEHSTWLRAGGDAASRIRLVVIGVGHLGESLLVGAAREWHLARPRADAQLTIALVDRDAHRIADRLQVRYPALRRACRLEPWELDVGSSPFARAEFLHAVEPGEQVPVFICLDDDSRGLSTALALARDPRITAIVVRMAQDAGLGRLLESSASTPNHRLKAFALLDRACRPEQVLRGTREILARAIHEAHVRRHRAEAGSGSADPSLGHWDELSEHLRESNREQADDLSARLARIGACAEPSDDWEEAAFEFDAADVERMAQHEHERWMGQKLRLGWRLGAVKDEAAKTHPWLVPWALLPDSAREENRHGVRQLPALLALVGFRVCR